MKRTTTKIADAQGYQVLLGTQWNELFLFKKTLNGLLPRVYVANWEPTYIMSGIKTSYSPEEQEAIVELFRDYQTNGGSSFCEGSSGLTERKTKGEALSQELIHIIPEHVNLGKEQ